MGIRTLVKIASVLAGAGIIVMMSVTCTDVIMRIFKRPLTGAFDIVRIAGVITITCALPYTTAVKGHVAIEFFFHKLSRRARIITDTLARLISMGLFSLLTWHSIQYGFALKKAAEVSSTLGIPLFWVPWVIAFSCALVVPVILYNLLNPGREMIKL